MPDPIDNYLSSATSLNKYTPYHKALQLMENDGYLKNIFGYNKFTNSVEFIKTPVWDDNIPEGKEITDIDLIEIKSLITKKHNFSVNVNILLEAITHEALKKRYHPIKDYLKCLVWDQIPRIDEWLHKICGCELNTYTKAVSRKILIAAVNRVFEPGCKFDYMAILEGMQGIRKGMLIEILASKKWYSQISFHQSNKEIVDVMRGKWIVEVSELHGFQRQESERLKAFITTSRDRVRLSYGRIAEDFPRQ